MLAAAALVLACPSKRREPPLNSPPNLHPPAPSRQASTLTVLASDSKVPVGNEVLLDAWNQMCMVWTAGPDGVYTTRYFFNGVPISPAVPSPRGTDVDYALYTLVGASTNNVANYTAVFGDVGFCTLPLGDTLPGECGGGVV